MHSSAGAGALKAPAWCGSLLTLFYAFHCQSFSRVHVCTTLVMWACCSRCAQAHYQGVCGAAAAAADAAGI
jgi:hypothetical protein